MEEQQKKPASVENVANSEEENKVMENKEKIAVFDELGGLLH